MKPIAKSALVLAIVICGPSLFADDAERPNIVLVMADDLGWGDVGFNGNDIIQTPHLDDMAAAGLQFNRFYSAAPVCSPTRGSCLTGRHPYRYGIFLANVGHMLPPEQTLAEVLRAHGYATGHFGKWHLGTLTTTERDANRGGPHGREHFALPTQHGFQVFFSTESKVPTWDPMVRPRGVNRRTWWDPAVEPGERTPYGTAYWSNGGRVTENLDGDDSQIIMDRVVPFLRNAVRNKTPFFAVVWFHTPHLPVVAGPDYAAQYAGYDKYHQHYYGCITALDDQVGRLRAELRDLGVAENTLVTFCSDNGPEGNQTAPGTAGPFRGRKRSLYEGGVRVPAMIEWPARITAGRTSDVPCCTSDYLPTVLDLLGIENPAVTPLDGISLLPLFDGEMTERAQPIGFQSAGQIALTDNRFKLIHVPQQGRRQTPPEERNYQLFDLLVDPGETTDVSADHPNMVARMRPVLEEWERSCQRSLAGEDYRTEAP
jgi:arylsulfatase